MKNFKNLRGRYKLWTVILVPLIIFIHYKAIICVGPYIGVGLPQNANTSTVLYSVLLIIEFAILIMFIAFLLFREDGVFDQINNWADDKF